jgi:hypothetical protein
MEAAAALATVSFDAKRLKGTKLPAMQPLDVTARQAVGKPYQPYAKRRTQEVPPLDAAT